MQISQLEKVTKVIVHANCPDGIASAIILRTALGLSPNQIVFVRHDSPEYNNLQAEPGLLFCDCVPPPDRTQEFVDAGTLVLDHHKYSKESIKDYGENGVFADFEKEPEVSGAWLAYREVWKVIYRNCDSNGFAEVQRFVKELASLAGIRDNWQQKNLFWKEACEQSAILMFFPSDFWVSERLLSLSKNWDSKFRWLGPVLLANDNARSKQLADKSWTYRTNSGLIISIMPGRSISDASDLVEDECDVVVGFSYTKNEPGCFPGLLLSLRSFGNSFDCGKFCQTYGGGGHVNAAGCKFDTDEYTPNPYKFLCDKFNEYLSTSNV